jgi:pantoate--beta-alanine ligase
MKIITTIHEMQGIIKEAKEESKSIGFVPTMGFLHEGHVSLIRNARKNNDIVVISIFVNPIQFGPKEDFSSYPRDFEHDRRIAENENVDYVFYPSVEEMYPRTLSASVVVHTRTNVLCGEKRPGHFDGVATVLTKLFNIVQPTRAYFGMKDAQQVAVVQGFISDFNFPIEIVPVETVREEDGLAKSSRNVYLSQEERAQAPILYKSLLEAKRLIKVGEKNQQVIIEHTRKLITENSTGIIDYIEIYSFPQLEKLSSLEGKIIIALAVKFEKARLIDNIVLEA